MVVGNGKEILKIAHFDTYAEDSTNLEIFLEGLYDNVILIAVTFDDASTKWERKTKINPLILIINIILWFIMWYCFYFISLFHQLEKLHSKVV